ncbi:MAG: acetyl-CoA acetyltransferase, partial [Nitrospinae bacterium RIFCSPLOWO2_12_39_16]
MKNVVIASAVRTPVGCFNGGLSSISATRLGSIVIAEAIKRAGIKPTDVDEVIMGNVLSACLGQAPARQASIGAGLPYTTNCLTVNKVCGSGLKAVMLASQSIALGDAEIVVAGGMESMSRAPYLMEKARFGYRMGDGNIIDSMIKDGLWDVYNNIHMGSCAEIVASKYDIDRDEQDRYALQSYQRAIEAQKKGYFTEEIISVDNIAIDEEPNRHDLSKLKTLSPVFKEGGGTTAGNSSKISDGAASVVIMSGDKTKALKIKPMAKIIAYAS